MDDEALAWYEAGLVQGIALGRAQVEAELAASGLERQEAARRYAVWLADNATPYAELARRRGDEERAAEQEKIMTERGI